MRGCCCNVLEGSVTIVHALAGLLGSRVVRSFVSDEGARQRNCPGFATRCQVRVVAAYVCARPFVAARGRTSSSATVPSGSVRRLAWPRSRSWARSCSREILGAAPDPRLRACGLFTWICSLRAHRRMWALLQLHAKQCSASDCPVPRCRELREMRRRQVARQEDYRRKAYQQMLRQQASLSSQTRQNRIQSGPSEGRLPLPAHGGKPSTGSCGKVRRPSRMPPPQKKPRVVVSLRVARSRFAGTGASGVRRACCAIISGV
jgi:hypothetical protein